MTTPQQSELQPLFVLSGASSQQRIALLESLLVRLEQKSIKTLIVALRCEEEETRHQISLQLCSHGDLLIPAPLFPQYGHGVEEYFQALRGVVQPRMYQYDLVLCDDAGRDGEDELVLRGGGESLSWPVPRHPPGDPVELMVHHIYTYLQRRVQSVPVWGCLLMGGRSSRMGRPKHLIEDGSGRTWVERTASLLKEQTDEVVLAGRGEVPESLAGQVQLHDIPAGQGPLAGILAAMRWNPDVNWLVSACDMPLISREGLSWLLSQRKPGVWASVPRRPRSNRVEPLLAYYGAQSRMLFETLFANGDFRIHALCEHPKVDTPLLPFSLVDTWRNCNTPEDVSSI